MDFLDYLELTGFYNAWNVPSGYNDIMMAWGMYIQSVDVRGDEVST